MPKPPTPYQQGYPQTASLLSHPGGLTIRVSDTLGAKLPQSLCTKSLLIWSID